MPGEIIPRILLQGSLTLVGLAVNGSCAAAVPELLWEQLSKRFAEIPYADPDAGYGLHQWTNGQHTCMAGLSVQQPGPVPEEMKTCTLPQHVYAVFYHPGLIQSLSSTFENIYQTWLPDSGYNPAADFYFEYYDDRFNPGSLDSVMFVYVPVEKMSGE